MEIFERVKNYLEEYMCDIETNQACHFRNGYPKVWVIGGIKLFTHKWVREVDMKKFWDKIFNDTYCDTILYFHNGGKFDDWYVLDYLICEYGVILRPKSYEKGKKNTFSAKKPSCITFIDDKHTIIEILIYIPKNKIFISIRDSYLILRESVERLGGKSYKMDYKIARKFEKYEDIPENDRLYFEEDILTVAKYLELIVKKENFRSLTIASHCRKYLEKHHPDFFLQIYNQFSLEQWRVQHQAYRGGIVWYNENYKEIVIDKMVYALDFVNHYPAIAIDYPLPYGKPLKFRSNKHHLGMHQIYIIKVKINDECIPFIDDLHSPSTTAKTYSDELYNQHIYLWDEEYELFKETYSGDYVEEESWYFQTTHILKDFFKELYQKRNEAIAKNDLIMKLFYKNMGNFTIGRFSFKPETPVRVWTKMKTDGRRIKDYYLTQITPKTDRIDYIPLTSYVNSLGRVKTIKCANECGRSNVFCIDTDGFKSLTLPNKKWLTLNNEIGKVKIEGTFQKFCVKRNKTYAFIDDFNNFVIKCAGLTKDGKENIKSIEEFATIQVVKDGDLNPVFEDGVVVLKTGDYHFKN